MAAPAGASRTTLASARGRAASRSSIWTTRSVASADSNELTFSVRPCAIAWTKWSICSEYSSPRR
ncbi:MAG: hypothetical protein M5U08_02610 [Burkholderiales bacterium]|nr:hypothetical protein [Burkholderiales bacterium]